MLDVLVKSFTFVLIIIIGYSLKKAKVLKKRDADVLATIVMNVTLPFSLLSNANSMSVSSTVLMLVGFGILANVVMIIVGYIAARNESPLMKGVYIINCPGYNIGNFALPFVSSFFAGTGVAYLCAFDIGNALMGLGITYAIADNVANGSGKFDFKDLFKKLFSSIPFDVYLLLFCLAVFNIKLPDPVISVASTIGSGNAFLAMLMIGILLEVKIPAREAKAIIKVIGLRLCSVVVMAALILLFLPLPTLAKEILVIAICAPLSSVAAVFTKRIGYSGDISAAANSISIIISIVAMTVLLMAFV